MGACGSRPRTLEGDDAPMELPAAKMTSVTAPEVTPAEASCATTEVTVELSEIKEETTEEKEAPLVDISETKAEEPKSEEVEPELKTEVEIVTHEETKGEPEEETINAGSTTEEVAKESDEKVAVEAKPTPADEMQ